MSPRSTLPSSKRATTTWPSCSMAQSRLPYSTGTRWRAIFVQQNLVKRGAHDGDSVPRSGDADLRDDLALLIAEHKSTRRYTRRADTVRQAKRVEDSHSVWRNLKPTTNRGR